MRPPGRMGEGEGREGGREGVWKGEDVMRVRRRSVCGICEVRMQERVWGER